MNSRIVRPVSVLAGLLLSGCAARRYQPAPIEPRETAARLESRTLADSSLQSFLEKNLGQTIAPWPPNVWDLRLLSLAALYFNPAMEMARARLAEAEAAIVTAGARPNPSLSVSPGVPSPYLLNLDFAVPIETAGKRGHRMQSARSLNRAAEFELANTAWRVHSAMRAALLEYLLASRTLDLLRGEEQIRREQVTLLKERLAVGEIPRPELDLARTELSKTHLAVSSAEGQLGLAKANLAGSIPIQAAALQGLKFSWPSLDSPPSTESLSPQQVQRDAVLNRLDVRRALAEYAAAEANLQLEISKQYPDIHIGPGYQFEEKNNFFTFGFSTTLPIFDRNRGPIAEAEARRQQSAAAFLDTQGQVVVESERALALYTAALKELTEANESLRTLQHTQEQMMRRALRLGEEDRLALNGVRLGSSVVARARLDALGRAQGALGHLEDAVQRPLEPSNVVPIVPNGSGLQQQRKDVEP
jgi:outer membrane protein, heavy metal efflux system